MITRRLACLLILCVLVPLATFATNQRDYSYRGQEHWTCQSVYWGEDEDGEEGEEFWYDSNELCYDCFFPVCHNWYGNYFSSKNHHGIEFHHLAKFPSYHCECGYPRFYAGYLHFLYKNDFPFLKKQIAYSSKYPIAQEFWPENNATAMNISDTAVSMFKELFRTTALKRVAIETALSKDFMVSSWYFSSLQNVSHIALCATCFHFSDYYQVSRDLRMFSRCHFAPDDYRLIESKLAEILDYLSVLFRVLYDEVLEGTDVPELWQEVEFIENLYNDLGTQARICPVCMPQKLSPSRSESPIAPVSSVCDLPKASHVESELVVPLALPGEKISPPDWCTAPSYFAQGVQYNDLFLFADAIKALDQAIAFNTKDSDAYLERAFAYFELGKIDLAIADYAKAKQLNGGQLAASSSVMRLGPMDYSVGLCIGLLEGSRTSAEELGPAMGDCASCLMKGVWAFACSPIEVSADFIVASKDFIEALKQTDLSYLQILCPEVYDLCCQWDGCSEYDRGSKLGFIVGKYGLDILLPAQAVKLYQKYRTLKLANTAFTMERIVASEAAKKAILAEASAHTARREATRQAAKTNGGLLLKDTAAGHIVTETHLWEKVVKLTGNPKEDLKTVLQFIEDHNIVSPANWQKKKDVLFPTVLKSYYKKDIGSEQVIVIVETVLKTGDKRLQNAYVVTKK
ncbi:MAG: hypothetical protein Q8K75_06895 [Chlamydiales bacterium]|nr:hypothetical protein [Chlamydiales bacterium]